MSVWLSVRRPYVSVLCFVTQQRGQSVSSLSSRKQGDVLLVFSSPCYPDVSRKLSSCSTNNGCLNESVYKLLPPRSAHVSAVKESLNRFHCRVLCSLLVNDLRSRPHSFCSNGHRTDQVFPSVVVNWDSIKAAVFNVTSV